MYIRNTVIFSTFFSIIMIVFDERCFVTGLNLGCFFCIINLLILEISIKKKVILLGRGVNKVVKSLLIFFSVLFRYSLISLPIIFSIKFESFSLVGSVIGLLSVQIVIILDLLTVIVTKKSYGPSVFT